MRFTFIKKRVVEALKEEGFVGDDVVSAVTARVAVRYSSHRQTWTRMEHARRSTHAHASAEELKRIISKRNTAHTRRSAVRIR